jgi:serine/threonine-protein kinase RsbW
MLVDVAVCLPLEAETVGIIRSVVKNALQAFGVTQDCVDDISLALSEACTNVIDHAVPGDEYEVRLQVDEASCIISVTNTGPGFDAEALDDAMPDPSSARGRGVAIMRSLMDQVDFRSEPEAGTIVHLVKTLAIDSDSALARLRRKRQPLR